MNVYWLSRNAFNPHTAADLPELLRRDDGFVWLDIVGCDDSVSKLLRETLGLHGMGVSECRQRAPIPKVHVYADHFFVVLHSAEMTPGGKVAIFQTAYFIHEGKFLVSVQLPTTGELAPELAWRETDAVRERLERGRFRPRSPAELAHAMVSSMAQRLEGSITHLAEQVTQIENSITRGSLREYERMLEDLFRVRHNLQAVRTIAATSKEIHSRMLAFSRGLKDESALWLQDLADHFDRLKNVCDGEKELMQEILDLYQTRVANDLSQLVRKLTALGAILVADTLVAGIYGMNFKNIPELQWEYGYPFALLLMLVISLFMARYFRKKDWL
jgi:magnesium transporter